MKKIILCILAISLIFGLVACKDNSNTEPEVTEEVNQVNEQMNEQEETEQETEVNIPKREQIGTAGSNIPLKDNNEEAEYQIKVAVQNKFEEIYGDKVFDARIYVDKIYSAEDENEIPVLKEMNLGMNEVAFEISYDLKPSNEADVMELSIPNGEYDEESGWIKNNTRVGVLRLNDSGDFKYVITDFGTGW